MNNSLFIGRECVLLPILRCERDPNNVPDTSVDASFRTSRLGGEKTVEVRLSNWGITVRKFPSLDHLWFVIQESFKFPDSLLVVGSLSSLNDSGESLQDSLMDLVRPTITLTELHCLEEGSISGYEFHVRLLRLVFVLLYCT